MTAEPWSKFFWSDYEADEGLRFCSLAAQGLWMRMLCLMARATPKGELRVGGEPCTVADLARAVGESVETVTGLLRELERRGVYSTSRGGVIFSRRLRNDAELSRKRAKAGANGAAVRYGKQGESTGCDSKSEAKPLANASPHMPEARRTVDKSTGGNPPDPVKIIFDLGLSLLTEQGYDERAARSLIGSWRKGRRDGDIVAALVDAQAGSISNLVEWMPKRLNARGGNGFGAQHGSSIVDQVLAEKEREERRMQQHTTAGGPC